LAAPKPRRQNGREFPHAEEPEAPPTTIIDCCELAAVRPLDIGGSSSDASPLFFVSMVRTPDRS
jgi:hypothetical protein